MLGGCWRGSTDVQAQTSRMEGRNMIRNALHVLGLLLALATPALGQTADDPLARSLSDTQLQADRMRTDQIMEQLQRPADEIRARQDRQDLNALRSRLERLEQERRQY
jgi:hypothetical protein